jgi:hypothetical protein
MPPDLVRPKFLAGYSKCSDAILALAVPVLVRREDPDDLRLGGFTFKRWERTETGARLSPVSKESQFKPILLTSDDEETTTHLARFIEVLHMDDSEVTA